MIYIATVWHMSSIIEMHEGWKGIRRFVVRREASNEFAFKAGVMDKYLHADVDGTVEFGPIGLSKLNERGMFVD